MVRPNTALDANWHDVVVGDNIGNNVARINMAQLAIPISTLLPTRSFADRLLEAEFRLGDSAGNDGDDRIETHSGDDIVLAGGGNDFVVTGDGNDRVYGDSGNDQIRLGNGNDLAFGGVGFDLVYGEAGDDTINGGNDADILFGDFGEVLVDGGGAITVIKSTDTGDAVGGADTVRGGSGEDIIIGGVNGAAGGKDRLSGDADNDILIGDLGQLIYNEDGATPNPDLDKIETTSLTLGAADDISGGDGADIAFGGKGDDLLLGDDLLDGTAGSGWQRHPCRRQRYRSNTSVRPASARRIRRRQRAAPTPFAATRAMTSSWAASTARPRRDKLSGEEGDDVILGDNGVVAYNDNANPDLDRVETTDFSLGGADEISGGAGRDFVLGGTGADLILGDDALGGGAAAGGDDILIGDQGKILLTNNVVTSIETTDTGAGDGGIDEIHGNGGADVALGGVAGDKISGDGGNDILVGDQGKILLANNLFTSIETTDDDASDGAADVIHGNERRRCGAWWRRRRRDLRR